MKPFEPMSGTSVKSLESIRYPKLCSVKLDGWRGVVTSQGARTRNMKPFPNRHIQQQLSLLPSGFDGEVAYVEPDGTVNFTKTESVCLTHSGEPKFCFFVFDYFEHNGSYIGNIPYCERLLILRNQWAKFDLPDWVILLSQETKATPDEVREMFEKARLLGHEGLVMRDPEAPYKHGKATLKQEWMLKMKPWLSTEGTVIGRYEEMENTNEATTGERGQTKRSSHAENKIGKGSLGGFILQVPQWKEPVRVGGGISAELRWKWWQSDPTGATVEFNYLDAGDYEAPRHAVFKRIRPKEDMPL